MYIDLPPPVELPDNETLLYCLREYNGRQIYQIRPWVYGNLCSGVIYGAIVILYRHLIIIRRAKAKAENTNANTKRERILNLYAMVLFLLCTVTFGAGLKKTVDMLMVENCTSGGLEEWNIMGGLGVWGNVCFMLSSWMADALLIWLCLIVYRDVGKLKWAYVSVPIILQIASIVLGSIFCAFISTSSWDYFRPMLTYECTTFALNGILTILIVGRLLVLRYNIRKTLGDSFGSGYANMAQIVMHYQAMMLISQSIMIALIEMVGDNGGTLVIFQVLSQVQVLAPMLIIYRIMQGDAWSIGTMGEMTEAKSFGSVDNVTEK